MLFEKNEYNNYWSQEESLFNSSVSSIKSNLNLMEFYSKIILNNENIQKLTLYTDIADESFYYTGMHAKDTLDTTITTTGDLFISSFIIYFPQINYIVSTNRFANIDAYYDNEIVFPFGGKKEWIDILEEPLPSRGLYELFLTGGENVLQYVVNLDTISYKKFPATIIYTLDKDRYMQFFAKKQIKNATIVITDNGRIVTQFGKDDIKNFDLYKLIRQDTDTVTINNTTYRTITENLKGSSLAFWLIEENNLFKQQSSSFFASTFIILFLSTISGIIFLVFMFIKSLNPIVNLNNQLNLIQDDKDILQNMIVKQRSRVCQTYVKELIKGEIINKEEMAATKEYLHFGSEDLKFLVICITAYYVSDVLHDKNKINSPIIYELLEKFTNDNKLYFYSPEERQYVVLLTYTTSDEAFIDSVCRKITTINNNLRNDSIWFFAGVGSPVHDPSLIWQSFKQATTAMRSIANGEPFLVYTPNISDYKKCSIPPETSEKLQYCVKNKDIPMIKEIFKDLCEENYKKRHLSETESDHLFNRIKSMLYEIRELVSVSSEEKEKISNIDNRLLKAKTLSQLGNIAECLSSVYTKPDDTVTITSKIQEYLNDNYTDPSICLTKISDKFGISETYVSHLFKIDLEINFSTYLENLRLESAMKLIKSKECQVSKLYLYVGYNNPTSFRRAFKKRYGFPPSDLSA